MKHPKPERNKPAPSINAESSPQGLEDQVIDALRTVFDPEIPVNIYELGLIYGIDLEPGGIVSIRMTLTSPGCPVAGALPFEVESRIREIPGVTSAQVEIVWDPPWNSDMISDAGKLQLGLF
jgi:FeS assembly SUF system protein